MATEYERTLGVVEAITAARDQCPSGSARAVAESALANLAGGEPGSLRRQAWLVMSALQGWRGERADQVRRSLAAFLDN